jgi:hypothetical protein
MSFFLTRCSFAYRAVRIALVLLAILISSNRLTAQDCPSCQFYRVSVTPDSGYEPDRPKNSTGHTVQFTVINTGNVDDGWELTCAVTGGVTCLDINPPIVSLAAYEQTVVTVTYNVGASGGRITLTAASDFSNDAGYRLVSTPPTLNIIAPKITNGADTALVHTRTPLVLATYNADAPIDTASLVVILGPDTVSLLTRRNAGLAEWEVDPAHQLQPGTNKTLTVKICHINAGCTTATRQLLLDNSGTPIVSFAGMPLEKTGNAAEVETGLAIPAYFSMGVARSTGLVFSTRQSYPRALVNIDIELTWPVGTPDQIKAILRDGIVGLDSLTATTPGCQAVVGRRCRVTLQADFSGTTYPRALRK